jgi:hypothetical protein
LHVQTALQAQEVRRPVANRGDMPLTLPHFRRRRATGLGGEIRAQRALDRSALLAELEVAVPAPERIVRWETATRTCPDCAENVARSSGQCRHCGSVLV